MDFNRKGNFFLAFFLLALAHTVAGQLQNMLKLKHLSGDPELVYDGNLFPPDLRESNLCGIINCDEEEEIARNESKKIIRKHEDADYNQGINEDYENIYDDGTDGAVEDKIHNDDDSDDLESANIVVDDESDDFEEELANDDYYFPHKSKLYKNALKDQLLSQDEILEYYYKNK